MPQTAAGLQTFLDYWLYGVLSSATDLGTGKVFLRKVQEESVRKLIGVEGIRPMRGRDPLEVLRAYLVALDDRGIMDAADVASRKEGDRLKLEIGPLCPYRATCTWLHEENRPVVCFRAVALIEALRQLGGRDFNGLLDKFGVPCRVTMTPERYEVG